MSGKKLYGLQLAMVNARFTTFQDTDHKEMVRKAPGDRRDRWDRASSPGSGGKALPLRTQRNTEEEASEDFTAKDAEAAKNEEQRELATVPAPGDRRNRASSPSSPTSEAKGLPQRAQRSAEEEPSGAFTAGNAEIAEVESQEKGTSSRIGERSGPQNGEGNSGVESAKSIFFGVEPGEGVADNRPVSPPAEPPRKSIQSEVLMIPKDVEHHLRR
jgi:hypothetical protein